MDPILSMMDCLTQYVDAAVEYRTAVAELRDHKKLVADRARANLEMALRQVLPRRSPSTTSMRIVLEHDPDDDNENSEKIKR